ncbi:S8 family serine peptidase [Luteolibacter sp. LG18]|uniref:DUF7477 domain-containing protein n=1 Tax=Luteolibacter sp. LG18 TaxID=2819286 RepID=UPI002B30CB3F|nr:hypothetical protein llg_17120 [Luteolibacter sp. LG18]
MIPRSPSLAATLLLAVSSLAQGDPASDALLGAARASDASRLVLALAEAKPDVRDTQGRTPLMLAAQAGSFECAKRLIWAGADPRLTDSAGKTAFDWLDTSSPAYGPLSLLLRCHAFCRQNGRPGGKARIPHLALVNDTFVDYTHPALAAAYQVNSAESKGRRGVDDDRNGFVDDVYGWNLNNDQPVRAPMLSLDDSAENRSFLIGMLNDYLKAQGGDKVMETKLRTRFNNPLVQQIGLQNLLGQNIALNDHVYAEMFMAASHGTHVAGIIKRYSGDKAKLTCATIGAVVSPKVSVVFDEDTLSGLAEESADYGAFVLAVLDRYRGEAIAKGRRASDYLRASGAGIANMSWCRPKSFFAGSAARLKKIYKDHGADPASVDRAYTGQVAERIAELPLELSIADAAAFALAFYENPDVLVVVSAGNDHLDNDTGLPSPQYLSRFFPNVLTVASTDDQGKPSSFTNYGVRSVQIAAPGEQIRSTILGGLEAPMSGTSMAAPVVAGVAAGIRADFPKLAAADLRRILEYSARKDPRLADKVATSGWVDADAARRMASTWAGATGAMLLAEVARDRRPGQDGPKITAPPAAAPKLASLKLNPLPKPAAPNPAPTPAPAPAVPKPSIGKGWRITTTGGFADSWRVVMSKGAPYTEQCHLGTGEWPADQIESYWKQGYRVTSIAGDGDGWNVVMSKGVPGGQRVLGMDFDQEQLAKLFTEGWRITTFGGWKNQWVFALGDQTGYGPQRYTLPTPLNDSRRDWIQKRRAEGMMITAVAGDDTPEDAEDGWLFVATANSGYTDQVMEGPGPWPGLWIAGKLREGYRVTSIAGGPGRSLVIMSKGAKLGEQVLSDGSSYPADWIQERW